MELLGRLNFDDKRKFGPKTLWIEKNFDTIFLEIKFSRGPTIFGTQRFLYLQNFGTQHILDTICSFLGSNLILLKKIFKHFFRAHYNVLPKSFGPKIPSSFISQFTKFKYFQLLAKLDLYISKCGTPI